MLLQKSDHLLEIKQCPRPLATLIEILQDLPHTRSFGMLLRHHHSELLLSTVTVKFLGQSRDERTCFKAAPSLGGLAP